MALDTVFCPKSIALVGASRSPQSVGYSLLNNLIHNGFRGQIYPVNPKAQEILGTTCYAQLSDLPEVPELVIIAVPATIVFDVVKQAKERGTKSIIVISAGFKEIGEEGRQLESDVANYCTDNNITLIGPNCLGVINPLLGLNGSFETVMPIVGSVAFISQSGALVSSLVDIANDRGLGFSKIISVGNKAQISEAELLPYFFADPNTRVILLYTETLKDAPKLIELVRKNQLSDCPKPIVMLKAGSTNSGKKASSSHTGSLAGSDAAYEAYAKQAGIIRVQTIQELLTTAHFLVSNPLPKGRNIAIITNAGGPGIIATDKTEKVGLTMAKLSDETKDKLKTILPASSHADNPVDVLGDATHDRYSQALEAVLQDNLVDSAIVIVTPQSMTDIIETASAISRVRSLNKTPLATSFIGESEVDIGIDILTMCKITHCQFPEDAVEAIGHATDYSMILACKKAVAQANKEVPETAKELVADLNALEFHLLDTKTTFSLLEAYGVPVVKRQVVQQPQDAQQIGLTLGNKLALKIISPDISHKTDVGGVLLNVTADKLEEGIVEIIQNVKNNAPMAQTHGVLVQEMVDTRVGQEIILGLKKEPGLGTMVMLGLGGIFVELLSDASFRFAPITEVDAEEMINELKAKRILYGFRGSPALDRQAIIQGLMALSHLATSIPNISEIDINPLFVRPEGSGAVALDARIVLG